MRAYRVTISYLLIVGIYDKGTLGRRLAILIACENRLKAIRGIKLPTAAKPTMLLLVALGGLLP